MLPEPDPYRVLQVDPSADPSVIQAAYHALARRFHPDGFQPDAARMQQLNHAYALLRDPETRRRHDVRRRFAPPHSAPEPATRPTGEDPIRIDPWRTPSGTQEASGGAPGVLDFGRYLGWRLVDVARRDPDYLRWLSRHSSGLRYREAIARLLPNEPDLSRRANSVA